MLHLASHLFSSRLLVVHNAYTGCQDDLPNLHVTQNADPWLVETHIAEFATPFTKSMSKYAVLPEVLD